GLQPRHSAFRSARVSRPRLGLTVGLQVTRRRSGTGRPSVAEDGRVRRNPARTSLRGTWFTKALSLGLLLFRDDCAAPSQWRRRKHLGPPCWLSPSSRGGTARGFSVFLHPCTWPSFLLWRRRLRLLSHCYVPRYLATP